MVQVGDSSEVPSRQEMFNRAWNGLKAQGWLVAMHDASVCVYFNSQGLRCAWGHVDPEATEKYQREVGVAANVENLYNKGIGLAAKLSFDDRLWAAHLQSTHDGADNGPHLERRMRSFARTYGLTVPDEP